MLNTVHGCNRSSSESYSALISIGRFWTLSAVVVSAMSAGSLVVIPRLSTLFSPVTAISFDSLKWLSQMNVGLNHESDAVESLTQSGSSLVETQTAQIQIHPKIKKFNVNHFRKRTVLGKVPRVDKILLSAAAPNMGWVSGDLARQLHDQNPGAVDEVDATERRKLLLMHRFLTLRIVIALNASAIMPYPDLPDLLMTTHLEKPYAERRLSSLAEVTTHVNSHASHLTRGRSKKAASRKLASVELASDESQGDVVLREKAAAEWNHRMPAQYHTLAAAKPAAPVADLASVDRSMGLSTLQMTRNNLARLAASGGQGSSYSVKNSNVGDSLVVIPASLASPTHSESDVSMAGASPELIQANRDLARLTFESTQQELSQMSGVVVATTAVPTSLVLNGSVSSQTPGPGTVSYSQAAPVVKPITLVSHGYSPGSNQTSGLVASNHAQGNPVQLVNPHVLHSLVTTQPLVVPANALASLVVNPPAPAPVPNAQLPAPPVVSLPPAPTAVITPSPVQSMAPANTGVAFVEAFDVSGRPVLGTQHRMYSSEVVGQGSERGWGLVEEAVDHWSTLAWYDPANNAPQPFPLANRNALMLISRSAGVNTQVEHAGFAFGKVARGWDVHFAGRSAGRSERPVYLYAETTHNSNGGVVHLAGTIVEDGDLAQSIHSERYFAILNIAPGAQWIDLEMSPEWGEGRGAIPAPILEGTGTYLDLTQISNKTLTAEFVGQDDDSTLGYSIEVREQPATRVSVDSESQSIVIPGVLTFGSYPFYLKMRHLGADGTANTFQYRVLPSQMHDYKIYVVPGSKVGAWLSEIQELVGNDNGLLDKDLVVVGVPILVQNLAGSNLLPAIQYVAAPSNINVRAYTVYPWGPADSPYDMIKENVKLRGKKTRFIGTVPNGLLLTRVNDEDGKMVWSELTMTWSNRTVTVGETIDQNVGRIINIVGPY